jgi:hypothetical protein
VAIAEKGPGKCHCAMKKANGAKNRIQTWALEEARRRLEVEGILKEPEDKS